MNQKKLKRLLNKASEKCKDKGTTLTIKRKLVLKQLVESKKLLSAYEIVERIFDQTGNKIPPMSVYRILDFLESVNLVHKLESQNKYLACKHITCSHEHEASQFLICQNCYKVKEVDISQAIIDEISEAATNVDFHHINHSLEVNGICQSCQLISN